MISKKLFYTLVITFIIIPIQYSKAQVHIGPGQTYLNLQAASPFISPGDTVYLHAGVYNNYQYVDGLQGKADKWITFTRYQQDSIIIRGSWQISSGAYLVFKDLYFEGEGPQNSTRLHIDNKGDCALNGHHILVENCYFGNVDDSNSFKFGGVDSFEIRNCVFKNNSTNFAGIALNICHDGLITGCYFDNIKTKAIQTKLGTRNITIEKNFFINSGEEDAVLKIGEMGGLNFHCAGDDWTAKDIFVFSNIIVGGRTPFTIGQSQDCKFINNTFIYPKQFVFRVLPDQPVFVLKNHLIANNIFYLKNTVYFNGSNDSTQNVFIKTIEINNNIFYDTDNPSWTGPDPNGGYYDAEELKGAKFINNLNILPIFQDFSSNDYKPAPNSPVIGAGQYYELPQQDFYGSLFNNPPSIGAAEKQTTTVTDEKNQTQNDILLYPNPVSKGTSFNVSLITNEKITEIGIYNYLGEKINFLKIDNNEGDINIPVSDLPAGLYYVKAITDSIPITKAFIIY